MCRTFHQDGVPEEWVLWNLFTFTLEDRARKWYHVASVEAGGDWKTRSEVHYKILFSTKSAQVEKRNLGFHATRE